MIRRLLFWFLVVVFVWIVITQFDEIKMFYHTLAQGAWQWILLAAILQVIYNLSYTGTFQSAYRAVGIQIGFRDLLSVMFASMFVGVVAPGGATAGMTLYLDDGARRGYSTGRITVALMLQMIAEFAALTVVLGIGLIYQAIEDTLDIYSLIGAGSIILITFFLVGVILLGAWKPELMRRIFLGLERGVNYPASWFKRPRFLEHGWGEKNAKEFLNASLVLTENPRRIINTFFVMLFTHLVDISSMYMLFLAFNYEIPIGTLVAGYSAETVAMIASPAPQGVGVVEGAMVFVYDSLGVPWNVTLTATLTYRSLTFWLPLVLGFILLRRVKTFQVKEGVPEKLSSIPILAFLVAAMGLFNIISAMAPRLASRVIILEGYSPLFIPPEHYLAAIVSGVALFVLALGLLRRKRLTWLITLIMLIAVTIGHVYVGGPKDQQAILAAGMGLWLVVIYQSFDVRSDWLSIRQGLLVFSGCLVLALGYGMVGFLLLKDHYYFSPDVWTAARQTALVFAQLGRPIIQPISYFGQLFIYSIYALGASAIAYFLVMLDRPVQLHRLPTPTEFERAKGIISEHGRSSMAFLALLNDKHYYFSPGGSLIAYTVSGRIAVTLSDPIGPKEDIETAIAGFQALCNQNDWIPAFCLTLPEYQQYYKRAGYTSICLGHEAVVNLHNFTLIGRANKAIRHRYNRLLQLGYQAVIHQPPISESLMNELREVSDEWLEITFGTEKRFFLGWFYDEYIRNCPIIAVHDPKGRIVAFANIVPEYQLNETTIDLMRHRQNMQSGTMDFLFVSLFQWAREQGFDSFNFGLSALSGLGKTPGGPVVERLLNEIYEHWSDYYNFKGLRDFKAKFHPEWVPQYLTYPSLINLPSVWISMALVNSGGWGSPWEYAKRKVGKMRQRLNALGETGKVLMELNT